MLIEKDVKDRIDILVSTRVCMCMEYFLIKSHNSDPAPSTYNIGSSITGASDRRSQTPLGNH